MKIFQRTVSRSFLNVYGRTLKLFYAGKIYPEGFLGGFGLLSNSHLSEIYIFTLSDQRNSRVTQVSFFVKTTINYIMGNLTCVHNCAAILSILHLNCLQKLEVAVVRVRKSTES